MASERLADRTTPRSIARPDGVAPDGVASVRRPGLTRRRPIVTIVAAASVLVSGYLHFYLYFRGGYRGIHPETVLGLTISRAFVINAVAGLVLAEALVLSLPRPRLAVGAALATVGFAVATVTAYVLSRTAGILGFTETRTTTEAVLAGTAELVALAAGLLILARARLDRRTTGPTRGR